jgi:hypothetical protein
MEFSYKLSEVEYVRACKLGRKASSRSVRKKVMFWVFIIACLMLLWAVIEKAKHRPDVSDQPPATQSALVEPANNGSSTAAFLTNVGPFFLLAGVWILAIWLIPIRLRRLYRKDPLMQGQFTVCVTPESISIRNTAGTSSQTGWNVYDRWREGKNLIILVLHSRACFAMSMAGLSEAQRIELRGILNAAIPKK